VKFTEVQTYGVVVVFLLWGVVLFLFKKKIKTKGREQNRRRMEKETELRNLCENHRGKTPVMNYDL